MKYANYYSRISSSLNGFESAISSCGTAKPVKEKDKPKLALEALLKAAPLLTSSKSNLICALLDFLICVFLPPTPPRPGEAAIISRLLDLLDRVPLPSDTPPATSLVGGDLKAAATVSTNWSDFVLAKLETLVFSILQSSTIQ